MNFDFSDDQRMLRDQAQKFLTDQSPPRVVRDVLEDNGKAYDEKLWGEMAALGWMGTAIPEEYGGAGLCPEDLCVLAEELGRSLAPTPFSSSVYLATEALLLAGSEDQKQKYLPDLAMGETIGCFALAEGVGVPTPKNISVTASNGALSGVKEPVADGDVANFVVVLARSGAADERGMSLYLVDLDGVDCELVETIDPTRSHARLTFNGTSAELLGAEGEGWDLAQKLIDRAAVYFAFEQVGGAQASLDMAVDYAKNRFAFGRPIGSYQAIKHKLADMYIATELARSNAYYGAWAITTGAPDVSVAAAAARVAASEAFNHAARENIQTHGGMGFTWEFDCHMYYRRAKILSLNLGGERRWKDRLISQLEARNAA